MAKKASTSAASTVQPLGDRTLIRPLTPEEAGLQSPSGIIVPDTASNERPDRGEVIAVGEGRYDENGKVIPMRVKKGDKVIFQWGEKVEIGSEEYYIVGENNILAKIA